jgi:DNA repair protein RadA/Sms
LALIISVLEKRRGINLSGYDIYLKVTGGVFLKDPSVDLGMAAAIISSYREKPLPLDMVYLGELGLSGEIRSVPFLDSRLKEIEKLGFKRAVIPVGMNRGPSAYGLELIQIKNLDDFIDQVMGG